MWETLVAIFLAYSTSGITSGKKVRCVVKMAAILKMPTYYAQVQLDTRFEKIITKYAKIVFLVVMTLSMTSQGDLKVTPVFPYKWKMNIFRDHWKTNNDIIIKFGVHRYHIIVNMSLWINELMWNISLMTSSYTKICHNFELQ